MNATAFADTRIPDGTKIKVCTTELEAGKTIFELEDANHLLGNTEGLRKRLAEDGYLLLRGFQDRDLVLQARQEILEELGRLGLLSKDHPVSEGIVGPEKKGHMFKPEVIRTFKNYLSVVNSDRIMNLFAQLYGGPALTYDYKWLRAVPSEEWTGLHYDIVYMGRGTKNLHTCWTPLDDIPVNMGTLSILLGSQHFDKIRQTYGQMDVDRDKIAGWFSNDPLETQKKFGGRWATTNFRAGDVILFGMYLMHASTANQTNRFRLSSDTRYQLASEPVDERWVGKDIKGHDPKKNVIPMEEARAKWGV